MVSDVARCKHYTMLAIKKASSAMPLSQINYVVIWKASDAANTVPPRCKTGGRTVVDATKAGSLGWGTCSKYVTSEIRNPSLGWNCTGSSPARFYCSTLRQVTLQPVATGPDYLGVYINVSHPWVTGLFGSQITMSDEAVTKLEPQRLKDD